MNEAEAIGAIKELLSDPERWGKGQFAFAEDGGFVCPDDPNAVRWCLEGAKQKILGRLNYRKARHYLFRAARDLGYRGIVDANDRGGFEVVHQILDLASAACQTAVAGPSSGSAN